MRPVTPGCQWTTGQVALARLCEARGVEQVRLVRGQMRAARTVNGDRLADSAGEDRHQAIDGEGCVVSAGDVQILAQTRHGVVDIPESCGPPSDGDQQRALGCIEEACPGWVCERRCGERDDLSHGETSVAAGMLIQMRMRRNSVFYTIAVPQISRMMGSQPCTSPMWSIERTIFHKDMWDSTDGSYSQVLVLD
jgi:hypothetical protein